MKELGKVVGASVILAGLLFVAVLASTLIGGVVGWIIGGVFPVVIASLNTVIGLTLTGFQMGTMLGFVGSFLSTTVRSNKF